VGGSDRHRCAHLFSQRPRPPSLLLLGCLTTMPTKHHRPAGLQRRSTSESNTKLTLNNLNLQKLESSSNLQLQLALNNATKDLPRGKGKKSGGRPNVCYNSTFQFFRSNPNSPPRSRPDRSFCHSNPQLGRQVIKSDLPLNCISNTSSHTHNAQQQASPAWLHFNNSTRPPPPNPTRNPVSLSLVPSSPPMKSKARAIQMNGSPARACL